ncbi:MAG: CheY-like receiver with atypical phosphorylation pocket [uncultured Ramlibacter sp.]|uniref:CheY-like receiver with atypical phosphorylation pocket n=1 Tax=uncultured Ramlibacter sp. TaxID=260755 RepID=A0A6J4QB07_9BURK|nr:MAG: CheY-like receiver with atypical phosphorylation pocket [uncultured Ramlibacter sp.]
MNFPLFHRPGTVVFLDDDPDYLEMLALVLPRHWHVKLFLRPADCIAHLNQQPPFWEADAWNQQQLVDLWRGGKPLIPQLLDYWSKYTERYALARVCVVDYSMPGMDGLEVLAELRDWPGARVLLTGQADEQIAVQAFNRGLIEQFIAKQAPDISRRLISAVDHLLTTPHARHAQTWRATLTPQQSALLREPTVGRELVALANKRWVEHVVIGAPFGILGLDADGHASWLQLETPDGLHAQAELAQVEGLPSADLTDIRQGRKLSNLELRQALGSTKPPELAPTFSLGQGQTLLGSIFAIDPERGPDPANGYSSWLARQDRRKVH